MKRRIFLKGGMSVAAAAVAAAAGVLVPAASFADWPKAAFNAADMDSALAAVTNGVKPEAGEITVKAPDIAENGAVVPITISTKMENVESISVLVPANPTPLIASFTPGETADPFVSVRIKMGKTSKVIALVKADGKFYSAEKEVKVTIGGCGG